MRDRIIDEPATILWYSSCEDAAARLVMDYDNLERMITGWVKGGFVPSSTTMSLTFDRLAMPLAW